MSDYYDGYREGMAQASRETAALREQLDAMLKSVADLKSLMMPPPPIHLTIPSARKPLSDVEIADIYYSGACFEKGYLSAFAEGFRQAEKHHLIGVSDE